MAFGPAPEPRRSTSDLNSEGTPDRRDRCEVCIHSRRTSSCEENPRCRFQPLNVIPEEPAVTVASGDAGDPAGRGRKAIGAAGAALSATLTADTLLGQTPPWPVVAAAVALAVFAGLVVLPVPVRLAVLAGALTVILVTFGVLGYHAAFLTGRKAIEPQTIVPELNVAIDELPVDLGAEPLTTVIADDRAWSLLDGGRLTGIGLPDGLALTPIPVATSSSELLLCGAYLVILTRSGWAIVRRATDGHFVRRYHFGGIPRSPTCSGSRLWLLSGDDLVRLPIPDLETKPGRDQVKRTALREPVEELYFWKEVLYAIEANTNTIVGYEQAPTDVLPQAALTPRISTVVGAGSHLLAVHESTSCVREINFEAGREVGDGIHLSGTPLERASDGASAVVAGYDDSILSTIADDKVSTYALPLRPRRVTGVAMDREWIILNDALKNRVLIYDRRQGPFREQVPGRQPNSCR